MSHAWWQFTCGATADSDASLEVSAAVKSAMTMIEKGIHLPKAAFSDSSSNGSGDGSGRSGGGSSAEQSKNAWESKQSEVKKVIGALRNLAPAEGVGEAAEGAEQSEELKKVFVIGLPFIDIEGEHSVAQGVSQILEPLLSLSIPTVMKW